MKPMIVSACLVGCACRYDGKSVPDPLLKAMFEAGDLIPVCPEVMGGLDTPRDPAEIVSESPFQICTQMGVDVTAEYQIGAKMTLDMARVLETQRTILKSKSPSCGSQKIYDGHFNGRLIDGSGATARILREAGMDVINEDQARADYLSSCTKILLLRHAESEFSSDERGRGLTPEGKRKAQAVTEKVAGFFQVDGIRSSPYKRAMDTVLPWAEALKLDIIQDERLRERKVAEEPVEDFSAFAQAQWLDPDFSLAGGESLAETAARGCAAIRDLEKNHRGETMLLATHGTWMGAVFHEYDPSFGYTQWKALTMPDLWEMVFYKGVFVELTRVGVE